MDIERTTARDRAVIENAMDYMMSHIDDAQDMLYGIYEDHFGRADQKEIDAWTANRIGAILLAASDILFEALCDYHMTLGHTDFRGIGPRFDAIRNAQNAAEADTLFSELHRMEKHMSPAQRAISEAAREKLFDMADEEAIPQLKALIRQNKGAVI